MHRRTFLQQGATFSAGLALSNSPLQAWTGSDHPMIACQQYPWTTFYKRAGRPFAVDTPFMAALEQAGFQYLEPSFETVADAQHLAQLQQHFPIKLRSLYVNCVLHDAEQVEAQIEQVLRIARAAQPLGMEILVTNPSPIRWGGPENKTDAQLRVQAAALDRLGKALHTEGIQLAYHTHDAEMRQAAREFHHMLRQTDPAHVHLCLDAHWIYRGAGDSHLALLDIVDMYADRVVELHLRQSQAGIWTEAFGEGDLNYQAIFAKVKARNPWLVLEQAVEEGSPTSLNAVEAHQQGLAFAKDLFA